ncbi:hypothetical protein ACLMJK_004144 [Lecanora helva]
MSESKSKSTNNSNARGNSSGTDRLITTGQRSPEDEYLHKKNNNAESMFDEKGTEAHGAIGLQNETETESSKSKDFLPGGRRYQAFIENVRNNPRANEPVSRWLGEWEHIWESSINQGKS